MPHSLFYIKSAGIVDVPTDLCHFLFLLPENDHQEFRYSPIFSDRVR